MMEGESEISDVEEEDFQPDSLGSIISYLLNSGQMRLLRFGPRGGFEANAIFDSDDDDDDDDDELSANSNAQSLRGEHQPDTSNMEKNDLMNIIQSSNASHFNDSLHITKKIQQREQGTSGQFSHSDFACCNRNYLPNTFKTLKRFSSKVFCGTYSSDGTIFMSACQDQHIRLYDTTNGQFKLFRDIAARDVGWSISDTAYSPDQMYIIYSSWCHEIHLCNIYGDHKTHLALNLRPDRERFCAFSVSFSADSREIITGGSDNHVYVYDRGSNQRILRVHAHGDDVNTVKFADDTSNILISAGDDGLCKVWDRRTLSELSPVPVGTFAGHVHGITYVSPKGDGRYFLSNSKDQSIKLWDMRRFSTKQTITEAENIISNQVWDYRASNVPRRSYRLNKGPGNDAVMTYRGHKVLKTLIRAKFSPPCNTGQQYIYTGCASGNILVFDILSGRIVATLSGAHKQCIVRDVSWHPYENAIMSSSWDGTVARWEYNRRSAPDIAGDNDVMQDIT